MLTADTKIYKIWNTSFSFSLKYFKRKPLCLIIEGKICALLKLIIGPLHQIEANINITVFIRRFLSKLLNFGHNPVREISPVSLSNTLRGGLFICVDHCSFVGKRGRWVYKYVDASIAPMKCKRADRTIKGRPLPPIKRKRYLKLGLLIKGDLRTSKRGLIHSAPLSRELSIWLYVGAMVTKQNGVFGREGRARK